MQQPHHRPSEPQTPPPAQTPEEIDYNELDNTEESLNAAEMTRHGRDEGRAPGETRKRNNPSATARRARTEEELNSPSDQFID